MPQKPTRKSTKPSDEEQVATYMSELQHPLKAEIEAVRSIIKSASPDIKERIKWNAPSYHYNSIDFVTFNHRLQDSVHLVFHNANIVKIASPLLEGKYPDRRMFYLKDMKEVLSCKEELLSIIRQNLALIT